MAKSSSLLVPITWLYNEFGLASVYHTGRDAILIIFVRSCRMFAFGANSLIIALFFASLDFTDSQIGLFMTLTLLGDVVLSLLLALVADRVGRRRVFLLGALLMVVTGTIFVVSENYWILLFAAVVGVVSPSGSDFGPFRAIEESTLSQLTTLKTRSDVLSWYVTTSALSSAIGTEFAGRAVDFMTDRVGWEITNAYHAIFGLYIPVGIISIICTLLLSDDCEIVKTPPPSRMETEASEMLLNERHELSEVVDGDENDDDNTLTSELDHSNHHKPNHPAAPLTPPQSKRTVISQISRFTLPTLYKLWLLLTIDSFADGMTNYSLTNYYLSVKFPSLSTSSLGDIFSASYFLAAISTIFASPLARHLGLINTMVFTHLPSSAAVLSFPLPRSVAPTVVLFLVRAGLNNMDQAPRAAFIAAVVRPDERTAVNGITSTVRTFASTIGPSVTGLLADADRFWIAFVVAGALRIAYDLGLFFMFVNMKLGDEDERDSSVRDEEVGGGGGEGTEETTELEDFGRGRGERREESRVNLTATENDLGKTKERRKNDANELIE